jgi:hypothetical protein
MKLNFIHLHKIETHRETLYKFLSLLLVILVYFGYLSYKIDLSTGLLLTAITWSFFVLCTPVADAGFLLDFPIRILFGIRMVISEVFVWLIAIIINVVGLSFYADVYAQSFLTNLLHEILLNPYPYWGIILLSGTGTFLSIYFGDEMLDVRKHKDCKKYHKHRFKYRLVFVAGFILLIVWAYYYLLEQLGVNVAAAFGA